MAGHGAVRAIPTGCQEDIVVVTKHWKDSVREDVGSPSLETCKTTLARSSVT